MDKNVPKYTNTATFAMGCFWGPDALFGAKPGVVRTRVGYAGGKKTSPTYRDLGDHTETIQIDYDPKEIGYEELLKIFLYNHDPTYPKSTQYRSMIFYHDKEQEKLAKDMKESNSDIITIIQPFKDFYPAEDYHQKYRLSMNKPLYMAFRDIYPDINDFVDSTAVTRANGYVSGHGHIETAEELRSLGLNSTGRKKLYDIWKKISGAE